MPEIKEEDFYSPQDKDTFKLIHSCSKPDVVVIGGESIVIKPPEEEKSKIQETFWSRFDGILRNAESTLVNTLPFLPMKKKNNDIPLI